MRRLAAALLTALALSACEGDVALPDGETTGETTGGTSTSTAPTSGEDDSSEAAAETTEAASACPPLVFDIPVLPFTEGSLDRAGTPAPPDPTTFTCVIDYSHSLTAGSDVARVVVETGEGRPFVHGATPVQDCQQDSGWWYYDAEGWQLELCGDLCAAFQAFGNLTIEFECGE